MGEKKEQRSTLYVASRKQYGLVKITGNTPISSSYNSKAVLSEKWRIGVLVAMAVSALLFSISADYLFIKEISLVLVIVMLLLINGKNNF